MMPWSGLSQTSVKHAYEMGTSELHRTSIMLAAIALTTNRSKYPKDLSQRLCEKAGRTRRPKSTALADHSVCAKSLDRSGPVTEVLSLHVYHSKIGGSEERLFEIRVDPGKMHESNLPTIEVMSFKNMRNDDD